MLLSLLHPCEGFLFVSYTLPTSPLLWGDFVCVCVRVCFHCVLGIHCVLLFCLPMNITDENIQVLGPRGFVAFSCRNVQLYCLGHSNNPRGQRTWRCMFRRHCLHRKDEKKETKFGAPYRLSFFWFGLFCLRLGCRASLHTCHDVHSFTRVSPCTCKDRDTMRGCPIIIV